jgi:hypothetical protein
MASLVTAMPIAFVVSAVILGCACGHTNLASTIMLARDTPARCQDDEVACAEPNAPSERDRWFESRCLYPEIQRFCGSCTLGRSRSARL